MLKLFIIRYETIENIPMHNSTNKYDFSGFLSFSDHFPKYKLPKPRPNRKTATTVATAKLLTPNTRPRTLTQTSWYIKAEKPERNITV
jgi:hypothetical protein